MSYMPPRPTAGDYGDNEDVRYHQAVWDKLWGNEPLLTDDESSPLRFTKQADGKMAYKLKFQNKGASASAFHPFKIYQVALPAKPGGGDWPANSSAWCVRAGYVQQRSQFLLNFTGDQLDGILLVTKGCDGVVPANSLNFQNTSTSPLVAHTVVEVGNTFNTRYSTTDTSAVFVIDPTLNTDGDVTQNNGILTFSFWVEISDDDENNFPIPIIKCWKVGELVVGSGNTNDDFPALDPAITVIPIGIVFAGHSYNFSPDAALSQLQFNHVINRYPAGTLDSPSTFPQLPLGNPWTSPVHFRGNWDASLAGAANPLYGKAFYPGDMITYTIAVGGKTNPNTFLLINNSPQILVDEPNPPDLFGFTLLSGQSELMP